MNVYNGKGGHEVGRLPSQKACEKHHSKRRRHVVVFTDGCALGNPGPGGWAYVMRNGRYKKKESKGYYHTTNNRMELMAVIAALESIRDQHADVDIYTDSQYVARAFTEGWIRKWRASNFAKRPNADLWRRLDALTDRLRVQFHWIQGHSGIPENEQCDRMAKQAACHPQQDDRGYTT